MAGGTAVVGQRLLEAVLRRGRRPPAGADGARRPARIAARRLLQAEQQRFLARLAVSRRRGPGRPGRPGRRAAPPGGRRHEPPRRRPRGLPAGPPAGSPQRRAGAGRGRACRRRPWRKCARSWTAQARGGLCPPSTPWWASSAPPAAANPRSSTPSVERKSRRRQPAGPRPPNRLPASGEPTAASRCSTGWTSANRHHAAPVARIRRRRHGPDPAGPARFRLHPGGEPRDRAAHGGPGRRAGVGARSAEVRRRRGAQRLPGAPRLARAPSPSWCSTRSTGCRTTRSGRCWNHCKASWRATGWARSRSWAPQPWSAPAWTRSGPPSARWPCSGRRSRSGSRRTSTGPRPGSRRPPARGKPAGVKPASRARLTGELAIAGQRPAGGGRRGPLLPARSHAAHRLAGDPLAGPVPARSAAAAQPAPDGARPSSTGPHCRRPGPRSGPAPTPPSGNSPTLRPTARRARGAPFIRGAAREGREQLPDALDQAIARRRPQGRPERPGGGRAVQRDPVAGFADGAGRLRLAGCPGRAGLPAIARSGGARVEGWPVPTVMMAGGVLLWASSWRSRRNSLPAAAARARASGRQETARGRRRGRRGGPVVDPVELEVSRLQVPSTPR